MGFEQGLSGLNAANSNLNAIGNNVSNASTVGFKQSTAQFADMFAASLQGSGATQIGTGTKVAAVVQQFTQGNITATSNPLDTAISGQGFFQLTDPNGAVFYSRNGQFQMDKSGFLVNNQGHKVAGFLPNAAGVIVGGAPVPLQINPADLPPKPSALATVGVNMNSAAPVPATTLFNPLDPTSYTNSTSLSVYDSLGANHIGNMYFQRMPITLAPAPGAIGLGATTVPLTSVAGLAVGNTITIPGAGLAGAALTVTISSIAAGVVPAGTVTFAPATNTAVLAGAAITTNAPSAVWNSYLTVDGVLVPAVSTTAGGVSTTVPATASTTVLAINPIGTTVTPASVVGLTVGSPITIAGNPGLLTITGIAAGVVTFSPATTVATAAGAALTQGAAIGVTGATLASAAGLAVGSVINIAGNPGSLTLTAVNLVTGVVSWAPAATTAATAAGAVLSQVTAIGATTVTPASVAGLAVGSTINIAGNPGPLTITGIAGGVVTFSPATTAITLAGAAVTGVTPLSQLTFNTLGALTATNPVTTPLGTILSAPLFPLSTTSSNTQTMTFNFATTTQFGGSFGVSALTQDGYTSGHLNSTGTSPDGTIVGRYSNGQTRPLGQIVLANFTGMSGLQTVGNNEWVQTAASGNPLIGTAGSSSLGVLQSSATEDSNVDLTAELVHMITAQRVYQANAQTIKTQDAMLQTIVSLR